MRAARAGTSPGHPQGEGLQRPHDPHRRDRPPPHLRDHLAPGRRQDHADRAPAARRRRHPARRQRARQGRAAAHPLGLDGHRARPRHLRRHLGDDVRIRRLRVQPARHAGPRGFLRGHLPHADRGRLRGHGDRRRQGHRGAHPQAVRDLPAARHPDPDLHQQDGPRGARPVRDRSTRSRSTLALDTAPVTWPVGRAADLRRHLRRPHPRPASDRAAGAERPAHDPARRGARAGARRAAGVRPATPSTQGT